MQYELMYSKRKTLAVQIRADGSIVVRAPLRTPRYRIEGFLTERQDWILQTVEKQKAAHTVPGISEQLNPQEREVMIRKAGEILAARTAYFAEQMGVTYGRITIREQKTRWGSCSAKGNLNFNCLLMLTPLQVCDYVIIHELCHRLEMNHSARFWAEVAYVMPDWRESHTWLKKNGAALLRRAESSEAIM